MLSILQRELSVPVYEEHYGLAHRPFSLTLDQRFVYPSRSYSIAVNDVRRALQRREGLVVVTGEIGTGKTMLCRTLLRQLDTPVSVSVVLDPRMSVDELLLHVLADFGVLGEGSPLRRVGSGMSARHELVAALQRYLVSLIPAGAYAVLVIDEAQHLTLDALEQVRLLMNFETDEGKLLQIVLVGQPDLERLLRRPEMRQIDQRIVRRCELEPLSGREVKEYIERRLSIAQRLTVLMETEAIESWDAQVDVASCGVSFTPSAVRAVTARSRGIPRLVNLLCDRALEIGWDRQTHTIDARIVRAAASRLNLGAQAVRGVRVATRTAIATAALVLLVAGSGSWAWPTLRSAQPPATSPAALWDASSSELPVEAISEPVDVRELVTADSFNVMVASFKSEPRAAAVAAQLEASGLPAFSRHVQIGPWHQVIVGPYLSETEVLAVQQRLAVDGHSGSRIFIEHAQQTGVESDEADVLLLRSADRVSLVLSAREEPQKVRMHNAADATLEVEVGPMSGPIRAQELRPADGVPLIAHVSIGESEPATFARARIRLLGSSRSNVRVAGRRIYIDLSSSDVPTATEAPGRKADHPAPVLRAQDADIETYREAVWPAVVRLKAMEPFVLSAVASQQPEVLSALATTLGSLEDWLQTVKAPREWIETHDSFIAAMDLATNVVEPNYMGDREAWAREAFARFDLISARVRPPQSPRERP